MLIIPPPCTDIEDFGLEYPKETMMFEYKRQFKYYNTAIVRISKVINENVQLLSMIDIGANIGDTVAVVRTSAHFPILAIEGEEEYFSYLKKNMRKFKDVQIEQAFLSDEDKVINFQSKKERGTAHLISSESAQAMYSLDTILAKYPSFKASKILKIDTDGFDNIILKGASNYLNNTKPIIFMEYDPNFLIQQGDDGIQIFKYLNELGYEKAIMYENFGDYMFSIDIGNEIFIDEMRNYFYKNTRIPYCDLLIFNKIDNDLFDILRNHETSFFKKEKL